MKPKLRYQVATVGVTRKIAYVLIVNDGWYTAAHLLTEGQRKMLKHSRGLRNLLRFDLEQKFWRFIGAK